MANFNQKNIDFARQVLVNKMTRPASVFTIYPLNGSNTTLLIKIINNATAIALRYISNSTTNVSITFVGKSVETVVQEINRSGLPIKATVVSNIDSLRQGDLIGLGSDYLAIPSGFNIYDRADNGGISIRAKKFIVRHKNNSSISLLPPYQENASLPWYPRISNGSFSQKYNGKLYHFYIPEFDNQSWSLDYGKPFKDMNGVKLQKIDQNIYQLPRFPVYWTGQNITIYEGDIALPQNVIEDIDINNGILYIKSDYQLSDDFTITYSYLETSFVYKDVNINGHFTQNPLMLEKYVVIYILPTENSTLLNKKCVYHVVGNSVEEAIASIVLDDPNSPMAIIGAYNIQQAFNKNSINILDTRSKGGGLIQNTGPTSPVHKLNHSIESKEIPIENLYQESYRFWDIGNIDGEPYPGAAAVAIDLPIDITRVMSLSDVKKKASKFLAAGVYPSIKFSDRPLPSVTGIASQVSCAYNLDLESTYSRSFSYSGVGSSIPVAFTGIGWNLGISDLRFSNSYVTSETSSGITYPTRYNKIPDEGIIIPPSIVTGDWSSFDIQIPIKDLGTEKVIEVPTSIGLGIQYLKSNPDAGISWKERDVIANSGSSTNYTLWVDKRFIDTRDCNTGELLKGHLFFEPSNKIKQYKDIKINSPIITHDLTGLVETNIRSIVNNILDLQNSTYNLAYTYNTVGDKTDISNYSDYILTPVPYNHLFNLANTPLETEYRDDIYNIGDQFLTSGCYTSGHYFKYFIQNTQFYNTLVTGSAILQYNDQLKNLNRYLNFRYRDNSWSANCDTGVSSSTGLSYKLCASSGTYGSFGPGIPLYWSFATQSGVTPAAFSGIKIPTSPAPTEIATDINYDYIYSTSFPAIMSTCLSTTGNLITNNGLLQTYRDAYDIVLNSVITGSREVVNGTRYFSGYTATSHWFVGHNKLGGYLGRNLFNIIEGYEYLYRYNEITNSNDISQPSYVSTNFLNYIYSGIETLLENGYDVLYHNLLRGGVTEPDVALSLYGYGWYLNNWSKNYGIRSKTYSNDYRTKYSGLFTDGLKQLIKNQINNDGELLETKTIQGNQGPFRSSTPHKILYPLSEALQYDYDSWKGITEGVINTIVNNYSVDGLYYTDPFKASSAAGKEFDVLGGLTEIYKSIATTGSRTVFEPMFSGLDTLRGTKFLPNFPSYDINPPVPDWQGVVNTLSFWKYYHTGDVVSSIQALKSIGINTLNVDLDYMFWKYNSGLFFNNLDSLFSICLDNKMRIIPNLISEGDTQVSVTGISDYYSYGHTGNTYRFAGVGDPYFMTGSHSGESYIRNLTTRYDNHPVLLAWSLVDKPSISVVNKLAGNGQNILNYLASAAVIQNNTGLSPIIYTASYPLSIGDVNQPIINGAEPDVTWGYGFTGNAPGIPDAYQSYPPIYNPRISFIAVSPNSISSSFLDTLPDLNKKVIITNYGDGTYGDYQYAIDKVISGEYPVILSNLYIKSGSDKGCIYSNLDSRNARQVSSIVSLASDQGVRATGNVVQLNNFDNKFFYNSGYVPSYTSVNLIEEIKNWSSRTIKSPLVAYNTGEFTRQISLLTTVQSGLDCYNSRFWGSSYVIPTLLSIEEMDNISYYRDTWNSANFLSSYASAWLLSGSIDNTKYDQFIARWGSVLGSICSRLNING